MSVGVFSPAVERAAERVAMNEAWELLWSKATLSASAVLLLVCAACDDQCSETGSWCEGQVLVVCNQGGGGGHGARNKFLTRSDCSRGGRYGTDASLVCMEGEKNSLCGIPEYGCDGSTGLLCLNTWLATCSSGFPHPLPIRSCPDGCFDTAEGPFCRRPSDAGAL